MWYIRVVGHLNSEFDCGSHSDADLIHLCIVRRLASSVCMDAFHNFPFCLSFMSTCL